MGRPPSPKHPHVCTHLLFSVSCSFFCFLFLVILPPKKPHTRDAQHLCHILALDRHRRYTVGGDGQSYVWTLHSQEEDGVERNESAWLLSHREVLLTGWRHQRLKASEIHSASMRQKTCSATGRGIICQEQGVWQISIIIRITWAVQRWVWLHLLMTVWSRRKYLSNCWTNALKSTEDESYTVRQDTLIFCLFRRTHTLTEMLAWLLASEMWGFNNLEYCEGLCTISI